MGKSALTPEDLARRVNRSGMRVRKLLRQLYPRLAPGSGGRWLLTDEMVAAVFAYYDGQPEAVASAAAGTAKAPRPVANDDAALEPVAGDSAEQRAAEATLLELLGRELGVRFRKRRLTTGGGAWTEVDGWSEDPPILVEAWAHQGAPKSAQKAKVMTDALKLAWAEATFLPGARKILLFSDEQAAARFRPGRTTWSGAALLHFGLEIRVVTLPEEIRAAVQRAQQRQFR